MAENQLRHHRDDATDAAHRELFSSHRSLVGNLVAVGDIAVAVGVPIVLWSHTSHALLIAWGVVIAITSYSWELISRMFPETSRDNEKLRNRWGWVSTTVWASLPWLVMGSVGNGTVAWVLVFVVVFAIGTDLLYLTQSDAPSLDYMVLTYGGSYLLAFGNELQLVPMGAVVVAGASFVAASSAWSKVSDELIEKRIESDTRTRIDALTGLSTRVAAAEAVDKLVGEGVETIYCAFIDIDDFKHLNDNHGYSVGDAALQAVGQLLREKMPSGWTVARFGGDEFVAIGPEAFDFDHLIEASIHLPEHADLEIAQSLSVGLTSLPAGGPNVESDLFREAAAALRFAKRLGKHQVMVMSDELRALEDSKVKLGGRAGAALEAGEIVPWAQTVVDLETNETVGLELLARWEQADGSLIMPGTFIPVIEDQGRGPTLGLVMITNAIEALASPQLRNRQTFIAVNVSARHLYHRRLPAEILALLGRHNVAPERLVLEITESQHLPSSPIWQETAHQLRTLGIGLAMDDFGTGYSSMEQLLEVPFTHVKVDRVITQALDRPGTAELASAIAAMAGGSGMVTVVEGIETVEQLTAMRAAGYRFGQGFLFHRPEPLADVMNALSSKAVFSPASAVLGHS